MDVPEWSDWEDENYYVYESALNFWSDWLIDRMEGLGAYESCRHEGKDGSIYTFSCRMSSGVKDGIDRNALENIEKPNDDGKDSVDTHCTINQVSKGSSGSKTEVEKQEGHFDDPVHPNVIDFFGEESLRIISRCRRGVSVDHSRM